MLTICRMNNCSSYSVLNPVKRQSSPWVDPLAFDQFISAIVCIETAYRSLLVIFDLWVAGHPIATPLWRITVLITMKTCNLINRQTDIQVSIYMNRTTTRQQNAQTNKHLTKTHHKHQTAIRGKRGKNAIGIGRRKICSRNKNTQKTHRRVEK